MNRPIMKSCHRAKKTMRQREKKRGQRPSQVPPALTLPSTPKQPLEAQPGTSENKWMENSQTEEQGTNKKSFLQL